MDTAKLRAFIGELIAEQDARMAVLRADKPTVTDGHSDGKRVRYVRAEAAGDALSLVLDMLDREGGAA